MSCSQVSVGTPCHPWAASSLIQGLSPAMTVPSRLASKWSGLTGVCPQWDRSGSVPVLDHDRGLSPVDPAGGPGTKPTDGSAYPRMSCSQVSVGTSCHPWAASSLIQGLSPAMTVPSRLASKWSGLTGVCPQWDRSGSVPVLDHDRGLSPVDPAGGPGTKPTDGSAYPRMSCSQVSVGTSCHPWAASSLIQGLSPAMTVPSRLASKWSGLTGVCPQWDRSGSVPVVDHDRGLSPVDPAGGPGTKPTDVMQSGIRGYALPSVGCFVFDPGSVPGGSGSVPGEGGVAG
ncbi:hypothetical protein Mal15_69520 [Stieleria maiorica]|uniref:Uncharacterized protein n=1 Tax=Stieleria maiorica TaxID=2795974 RepID=A0A5B9MRD9_9BACT|nr:hypothetical protein Mal15_69520 [Stieleria maiorica]